MSDAHETCCAGTCPRMVARGGPCSLKGMALYDGRAPELALRGRATQAAKAVQCSLEYTTLRKVTQATEIYYDPIVNVRSGPRHVKAALSP